VNEDAIQRKAERKAKAKLLAIEDRITGMLVRRGVPYHELDHVKMRIADRLKKLTAVGDISWRDVEIVTSIVLKEQ